jgi:hypothetical protein
MAAKVASGGSVTADSAIKASTGNPKSSIVFHNILLKYIYIYTYIYIYIYMNINIYIKFKVHYVYMYVCAHACSYLLCKYLLAT